jgi:hypothetical protein
MQALRNPEGRREVVGQMLDYAKELNLSDNEDFLGSPSG